MFIFEHFGYIKIFIHFIFIFANRITKATIGARIDILSIKYSDKNIPDYYKQICIKERCSTQWKFDKEMIEKFKSFNPRQTYLSH